MERYPDVRIENIVYDSSHKHKYTTSLPTPLPSPTFGTEFEHHRRYSHSQPHRGHLAPPSPRDTTFPETFSSGSKHNDKMCTQEVSHNTYSNGARPDVTETVYKCEKGFCAVPKVKEIWQTFPEKASRSEPRYGGYLPAHLPPTPRESKEPSPVGKRESGYLHGTRVSEPSRSTRHHDDYPNYKYSSSPPDSKRKSDVYTRPSVVLTQTLGVPREETTRRRSPHERDPSPKRGPAIPYREHSKSDRGYDVIVNDLADEDRRRRRAHKPSDAVSTTATTGIPTSSRPPLSSHNPGRYGSSPNGPSGMDSLRRRNSVSSRNDDAGRTPRPRTVSGGSRSRASSATGVRFADEVESKIKQQNAEIAARSNKPTTEINQPELKSILKKPAGAREETKEHSKERKGKGVEVDMTVEELRRSVESLGLRQSSSTRDRDSNVSSSLAGSMADIDYDRLRSRFERDNGGSTGRLGRERQIRDGDRYLYY